MLTVGDKRIPVEIKFQAHIDPYADTESLRAFIERAANNAVFGLLVTRDEDARITDPRIVYLPLSSLLLLR